MNGFFKRDFYLIRTNLRFYLLFIGVFAILTVFTDFSTAFLSIYVVIFAMSSVMGLFSYDDMSHWTAYGAAAPAGRMAMVDARYLLTLLLAVGISGFQLLLSLLGKETGVLPVAALYGGVFLLYAAVVLPVSYHFGGTKARTVMVLIVAVTAAVVGMGATALQLSTGFGRVSLPSLLLLLPLAGLFALALSWRVSLGIMGRKEL